MAISLAQLIQETRETAAVQNTQVVSDSGEMPRIVNQAISNCYDTVVEAYAPYFAAKADFTLGVTGVISLDQIVNPTQSPQAYANGQTLFVSNTVSGIPFAVPFSLLALPVTYTVNSFTVTPSGGAVNTGTTTFQIMVNGVATGDLVTLTNGQTAASVNTAVNPTFNVTDVVTLNIVCASPGTWTAILDVIVTANLNNAPFYKELGVDFNSQGRPISVPRLDSLLQRNQNNSATSDVGGNYSLLYVPSCPVLDDVTDLPFEMERFRTMILLEGAIMIYIKREKETGALEGRLAIKKREVQTALRSRINEPKAIPMRGRNGGCGRVFDIIGPNLQMYKSVGYTSDYFWTVR